jgi:hypothetical protein
LPSRIPHLDSCVETVISNGCDAGTSLESTGGGQVCSAALGCAAKSPPYFGNKFVYFG